ncbi:response regulator [Magnetofaba australis]|uniref:Putative LuxR family transcriptional regulator n=1 Tax=Magnetofaba australis IT-1 TaxID=1434232 RepID=A0A1Y2K6L8_9PROT|nr:response regulator transcription factor [Magnetofaba australis]OSM05193.1 putative LuxR family transcriptional regulator [Magnetofaba australis IT-1]
MGESDAVIRLVLADDHGIFRQGLAHLLAGDGRIEIVGDAADGDEALALIRKLQPDVAILDISMPGLDGIEVARRLGDDPELATRVILLTMHIDPTLALEGERAGAMGFVVKDNTFSELADAIDAVVRGEKFYSAAVRERVAELDPGDPVTTALSPREREVLRLVASGLTNKEMAREMEISPKTVDTHRIRLMRKLNVHTTAELVRYAMRLGLVK